MTANPKKKLISRMRKLGKEMRNVGTAIDYFAGLDAKMARNGRRLAVTGLVVQSWADTLDEQKEAA